MNSKRRFGVTIAWQGSTIDGLTTIASEADNLGYGYIWIPEAWGLEAFATASHILNKTTRITIGTGIVNVYSRSAALIGMSCATIDQIAKGRFILGLGSSGKTLVEGWHGMSFEKPLKRTEEYVNVIRKVAKGEPVEYAGEMLKLSRFRLFTKPVESNLEIYLGAIGEANLKLARRICDGAIVAEYPISRLEHALKSLGIGKKLFAYFPTTVAESNDELVREKELIAKNIGFYVASMGSYYSKNLVRLGFEEDVNRILEAHSKGGSKAVAGAVSERLLDELSFIGSPIQVIEKVSKLPEGVIPVFAFSAKSAEEVASALNSMKLIASSY